MPRRVVTGAERERTAGRGQRAKPPAVPERASSVAAVLAMQRSSGNQHVARLLAGRGNLLQRMDVVGRASDGTEQVRFTPDEPGPDMQPFDGYAYQFQRTAENGDRYYIRRQMGYQEAASAEPARAPRRPAIPNYGTFSDAPAHNEPSGGGPVTPNPRCSSRRRPGSTRPHMGRRSACPRPWRTDSMDRPAASST